MRPNRIKGHGMPGEDRWVAEGVAQHGGACRKALGMSRQPCVGDRRIVHRMAFRCGGSGVVHARDPREPGCLRGPCRSDEPAERGPQLRQVQVELHGFSR